MKFSTEELNLILYLCAEAQDYAEHGFTTGDLRDPDWLERLYRVAMLMQRLQQEGGLKI